MSGNQRLQRRNGVYYYRRRVPQHLVEEIGKQFVQHSLNTTSLAKAKQLRALNDLKWDARFDGVQKDANPGPNSGNSKQPVNSTQVPDDDLLRLVREYVERKDEEFRKRLANNPPESEREKAEMRMEAKLDAQIIRDRDDPQADQWVYSTGKEILQAAGKSVDDPALFHAAFAEWVRRGLLEIDKRSIARLADDHGHAFFDQLFNPARPPRLSFGELADQYLQLTEEDAETNRLGQKGIDRQRATVRLIREIIGDSTSVDAIDYDTCLRVRTTLARIPANRTKTYGTRPLEEAIERAAAENKALLSPVTQQQYLAALRDLLDLAAKKRLIPVNPAEGLKPIKRDTIAAGEKRRPFKLEQIKQFFQSTFYSECAKQSVPFAHDKSGWRFWLPLICLFTGMRPNEAAQMHLDDLKYTSSNWRAAHGEEAVLASIVCRLAAAPKDRSADYLMWVAAEHPDQCDTRAICSRVSLSECLSMVTDVSRLLADRAVAAWFCSGINYPYQHRVGAGNLSGLADAYCRLGAPADLVAATVLAAKRTRQPYAVLVPLVWLEVQRTGLTVAGNAFVPPSGVVAGIPLYALDEHTRLGKRAINTLAQESPSIRACLQQYVPRRRWIAAGQHAAFYAEGSAVSRRLHWAQSQSLEALGIEAELSTAEVRPHGVEPLIGAIRGSLDQLNAIRTHLLLTVGSDAG